MDSKEPKTDERAKYSETCENVHTTPNLDIDISLQLIHASLLTHCVTLL